MVSISRQSPRLPWTPRHDGASPQAGKVPRLGGDCTEASFLWSFACWAEVIVRDIPKTDSGALIMYVSCRCVHHLPHQPKPRILVILILSLEGQGSLPSSDAAAPVSMLTETTPSMVWSDIGKSCNFSRCPFLPPGVETYPVPISGI